MSDDFAGLLQGSYKLTAKERLRLAAAVVRGVNGQRIPLHEVLNSEGRRCWPRVGGHARRCQRTLEEREVAHRALQPLRTSEVAWIVATSSPGLRRLSADVGHPIHMVAVVSEPDDWWLEYLAKAHFWRSAADWVSEAERTADRWNYELLNDSAPIVKDMVEWVTVEDYGIKVELPHGMDRAVLKRHVRSILASCSLDAWQHREEASKIKNEGKLRKYEDLRCDQDGGRWELIQDLTIIELEDGMPRLAHLVEGVLIEFSEGRL